MMYNLMAANALGAANWMKWDNDVVANNEAEQDWKWMEWSGDEYTQDDEKKLPWKYLKCKLPAQW